MIKLFVGILTSFILCFSISIYTSLPWWFFNVGIIVSSFWLKLTSRKSFISHFIGCFLCWISWAIYLDLANNSILSIKISQLFYKSKFTLPLFLVTGLLGGLMGGFSSLIGYYAREFFISLRNKPNSPLNE